MDEKADEEDIAQLEANASSSLSPIPEVIESMMSYFEKYKYRIQSIFEHYCSLGESENLTKLKNAKFIRMLRECGIVKPLNV